MWVCGIFRLKISYEKEEAKVMPFNRTVAREAKISLADAIMYKVPPALKERKAAPGPNPL